MGEMSDSERLDAAIRRGLGIANGEDLTTLAYGRTEYWDSVAHMQLVAAIETEFGIMMETDDVIAMSSYAAARQILTDNHGLALDA
jgi:acyl carrier protein